MVINRQLTKKEHKNDLIKKRYQLNQGFTLMEAAVALFLSIIILGGIATLATRTVKNGKFTEKLVDTNVLLSQKTNDLFNNSESELARIPKEQNRAGSIDPSQPNNGYFDLLNESGCVIKGLTVSTPEPSPNPTKGITNSSENSAQENSIQRGFGSPIKGDETPTEFNPLDCSFSSSISSSPSKSSEPKFRRQWVIVKDFPSTRDITFSVVVVAISTNQIIDSNVITKVDGFSNK